MTRTRTALLSTPPTRDELARYEAWLATNGPTRSCETYVAQLRQARRQKV